MGWLRSLHGQRQDNHEVEDSLNAETVALYVAALIGIINTIGSLVAAWQSRQNNFKLELAKLTADQARRSAVKAHTELSSKVDEVVETLQNGSAH